MRRTILTRRGPALALVSLSLLPALASSAQATFPGATGQVAFQSDREVDWEIYTMNPDGSDQRPLLDRPGTDEFNPAWAPNGQWLALQTGPAGQTSNFDIAIVNADGTEFRTVVGGPTNDRWPRVCLDDWIVFQRTAADGSSRIWKVRTDGSELTQLTNGPGSDFEPTCHPAADKVAFSSTREGTPFGYEIGLDGKGLRKLTTVGALDLDYSPDGKQLAFASQDPADGNTEIYTQDLASGQLVQRTHSPATSENRIPAFVPDFGSATRFFPRQPLTGSDPFVLLFTERLFVGAEPVDERVVALRGVHTGVFFDPCAQFVPIGTRLPQGPGDTGGPGKNSAPNAQPRIACTKVGPRKLDILGTAGNERIDVVDAGDKVHLLVNGTIVRQLDRADLDDISIFGRDGADVIIDRTTLPIVVIDDGSGEGVVVKDGHLQVGGDKRLTRIEIRAKLDGMAVVEYQVTVQTAPQPFRPFEPLIDVSIPAAGIESLDIDLQSGDVLVLDPSLQPGSPNRPSNAPDVNIRTDAGIPGTAATLVNGKLEIIGARAPDSVGLRVTQGFLVTKIDGVDRGWFPVGDVDTAKIVGTAGSDTVKINVGLPTDVKTGKGNDKITGGTGPDRIDGGGGNDRIIGGKGRDSVLGGKGNDTIDVRDGQRDVVDAGGGTDTVLADGKDVVRNAEEVTRR